MKGDNICVCVCVYIRYFTKKREEQIVKTHAFALCVLSGFKLG